jgi:hypothetical protein
MTPKEKSKELYEAMRTPIGESDLHIPNWISRYPEIDYPIEENQVAKECAIIAAKEMLNIHGSSLHQDYWNEVLKELESF